MPRETPVSGCCRDLPPALSRRAGKSAQIPSAHGCPTRWKGRRRSRP
jgi:hypothetical protein